MVLLYIHGSDDFSYLGLRACNVVVQQTTVQPAQLSYTFKLIYLLSTCTICTSASIYCTYTTIINNLKKRGIANIGYRPTFNGKRLLLEVNIFGIKRNLYKKILKISFIKFIRAEKKFKNINELTIQIKKDIESAKK